MTTYPFNFNVIDPSWKECLQRGLAQINQQYLDELAKTSNWLPGPEKIFSAFSLPIHKVRYVLFGESPYPRRDSANGYAFWDASVKGLWTESGLSKQVNRATSLRNILKMLLIAEDVLDSEKPDQANIAKIDKRTFIQTNDELFENLLSHGFLLLNATPVLRSSGSPRNDARVWLPFTQELLTCLLEKQPSVHFILFGKIAYTIDKLIEMHNPLHKLYAEHPYNISFITNQDVISFFKPLHLLRTNRANLLI